MAPPFTLTLLMSGWCSFSQASTTEAKASLISTRSMSSRASLDFVSTRVVAGMGAVSMMTGIVGRHREGVEAGPGHAGQSWPARSSDMMSAAAAPSEIWDDAGRGDQPVLDEGTAAATPASRRWSRPGPPRRR